MDTKTVQKNLQKAYETMLDHVEELVNKDKKPLKQAFLEAEEKISEWRELSREEVEHISDELKSNLSEMGEATHRLNKSLKETLSFDASYLADSIWSRLSKVADNTKLELSELSNDLRRHMSANASTQSEQQQVWLDDAMAWQGDYEKSLKQLNKLRAKVNQAIRETDKYSKSIIDGKTDQARHDLLSQKYQELTQAINNIDNSFFGD